jgi:hypothetical protein
VFCKINGAGCIMRAMVAFMLTNHVKRDERALIPQYERPAAGTYVGRVPGNRSVTVVGDRTNNELWCKRDFLKRTTTWDMWNSAGMNHYTLLNKQPLNKTCLQVLLEKYGDDPVREILQRSLQQQQQQYEWIGYEAMSTDQLAKVFICLQRHTTQQDTLNGRLSTVWLLGCCRT